jgi:hypothetical protein
MTVLVCGANLADILDGLHGALLTDEEYRSPQRWLHYDDPFGDWHEDPCGAMAEATKDTSTRPTQDGDR